MYINIIQAAAFKGLAFQHELTPCTLIVGRNFAGKTTRLQALQLAILGYLPGYPRNSCGPFAGAEVKITFDTGAYLSRHYPINGDRIIEEADSSMDEDEIGALATPTLDAEEYFALGPADQVRYIYEHASLPETHSLEAIVAELAGATFPELDPVHVTDAKAAVTCAVQSLIGEHGVATGLGKLTGTKGAIDVEITAWNRLVKERQGAVKTLAELRIREGECSADVLANLRAKEKEVGAQLAKANEIAGGLTQRRMTANRATLRRSEIEKALAAEPVNHTAQIELLKQHVEKARAAKLPMDGPTAAELQAAERQALKVRDQLEQDEINTEQAIRDLNDEADKVEALEACPYCKCKGKGWKKNLLATINEKLDAASAKLEQISDQVQPARDAATAARLALDKREADDQANRLMEQGCAQKDNLIERLQTAHDHDARTRVLLAEELERLDAGGAPTDEEVNAAAQECDRLKKETETLRARADTAVKLQQDIKRAAEAEQEHAKAKAYAAVYSDAKKRLKARQEAAIAALFGGLLATANFFTDAILPAPLLFRDGVIGMARGNQFVSVKAFSGTERAVTYIAVAAALAAVAPLKLALLDEMGRLDPENKIAVMERLAQAVERGIIHQAIAIDTTATNVDGWSVINL